MHDTRGPGLQPSVKHVPDYHNFVPKSSVILLPDMQKKAKAGRYLSLEQFRYARWRHWQAMTSAVCRSP